VAERKPVHKLSRDIVAILAIALAPAVGLGIARFAYSLILPDMRMSLGWSYAEAGFMNTVNAAGYLVGALVAARLMRGVSTYRALLYGTMASVAALALSAASADFTLLSFARLVAGIGAAIAFVAGGVMTVGVSLRHPRYASFLLSLYYIGPGAGILLSGAGTPLLIEKLGSGSWWVAWAALAMLSAVLTVVMLLAPIGRQDARQSTGDTGIRFGPIFPLLAGYMFFGVGSIAYMTFVIAWLGEAGGSAILQSAFWSAIGVGAFSAPFLWSGLIARLRGGRAVALLTAITLFTALAPLWRQTPAVLLASALIFGGAFFAVVAATTAFARRNYPPGVWPRAIGAMTVAFGIGQMVGPVASGAITDATGSLSSGLEASVLALALAVAFAAAHRDVAAADHEGTNVGPDRGEALRRP
jgi:predicted MFS family arabinose efflux permease